MTKSQETPPAPADQNGKADLSNLPIAPDGLNQLETAYWHIERGMKRNLRRMLTDELGDIDKLKNLPVDAIQRSTAENQWSDLCEKSGFDSGSRLTRLAFMQLLSQGASADEAATVLKEGGAATPKRKSATPITPGATASADVERVMPRDNEHAGRLAAQGKRVPHYGIQDVFRLRKDKEMKRA